MGVIRTDFAKALLFALFAAGAMLFAGCSREESIKPAESPEEVVRKFYAYIKEGGTTTLGEAYRLVSTEQTRINEEIFKNTVSKYPKDMEVKVLGSAINGKKAVVTIEYRTESSFGGFMVTKTEVNLVLDSRSKSWKIDFAGDTYEENPGMYSS